MKKNQIIILVALLFVLAVVAFMAVDFFKSGQDTTDNVYEFNLDKFTEINPELVTYNEVYSFSPEIEKLRAIAIDNNDQLFVTGKEKILVYSIEGQKLEEFVNNVEALSLSISPDEKIYLGVRDHIEVYNTKGKLTDRWEIFNNRVIITSITQNENGVFAADAGNKIVYHFSHNGELLNKIGAKDSLKGIPGFVIPSPYFDLAIGREGELWVVNSGRHQLEAYNLKGDLISSWKKTSMGLDGFSGCCNPSHIAMLSNGSFVTSEKGLVRIKIHSPTGEFESVVATPDQFTDDTKGLDLAVDSEDRIYVADPKQGKIRVFEKNTTD